MVNAIIRLRRDNDYNYAKIKDTFIPADGEICLVDTARYGLKAVCGDGVSTFGQLEYIGESFQQGYWDHVTGAFYYDKKLTQEIVNKRENVLYLDIDSSQIYYYTGSQFKQIELGLPTASETVLGVLKLYNNTGDNTDGTMTQKAITNELENINDELDTKVEVSLKEDEELVIFSL